MKIYKRPGHQKNTSVVLLAYFHRYGYIFLMLVLISTLHVDRVALMGAMFTFYGLYTIAGTKLGLRHLYCSMQNMNYRKMSPSIHRHQLTPRMKKDLYAVGGICTFLGVAALAVQIFFPGR